MKKDNSMFGPSEGLFMMSIGTDTISSYIL